MYDSEPYKIERVHQNCKTSSKLALRKAVHVFFVRTKNGRYKYLVEVHYFPQGLVTVDFYMKSQAVEKYQCLTGIFFGNQYKKNKQIKSGRSKVYEVKAYARLIKTVITIMVDALSLPEVRAVGFYGENTIDEHSTQVTQRFRIYRSIAQLTFSPAEIQVYDNTITGIIFAVKASSSQRISYEEEKQISEQFFNNIRGSEVG